MNQYDFKEFRILRCPHRGKYDNLTFTIELSKEDAPLELELYLRKCWQDGVILKAEVDEIEEKRAEIGKVCTVGFGYKSIKEENKSSSIYQEFKWFCERNGKDYEKEKMMIADSILPFGMMQNIEHMKDLEQFRPLEKMTEILTNRMSEINEELGFYSETN